MAILAFGARCDMSETIIKDHPCSKVWLDGDYIYKWQPKFLSQNELWCLEVLFNTGFVPKAKRVELEVIQMEFIKDEPLTDVKLLLDSIDYVLIALDTYGIRHGDLTRPNVLIRNNHPVLLDFSESRLMSDPRPDKRPEGDDYWLNRTIEEIINGL